MLLANMTVARIIKEVFASKAVLRCHEPIKPKDQDSLVRIPSFSEILISNNTMVE